MLRARIVGTGHFLPDKVYTNSDLAQFVDTTDQWIRQRTGIAQRHIAEAGCGVSDLMTPAAEQALDMAGVQGRDIDLIIGCTVTPDYLMPASASIVQHRLGANRAGAFDLNAACTGFVYALSCANAFIQSGVYRTVLIVAGELVSNRMNWQRRNSSVLFGDGAGAAVLQADTGDRGVLSTYLRSDGGDEKILWVPDSGSRQDSTDMPLANGRFTIEMKGPELFRRAIIEFGDAIHRAFEDSHLDASKLDMLIPHQANRRIIAAAAERAGIPMEKTAMNIEKVGNTIAASIPIVLDQVNREGRLKAQDNVLFAAFGAGLTWGSSLVRW